MSGSAYERQFSRKKRSYTLRMLAIALNLYLLFLLFDVRFFLYSGYVFSVITVIFLGIDLSKMRKRGREYNTNLSISDVLVMAVKYIRVNKVFLVATILGLILSTIVISQTVLLSASYEQNAFEQFISGNVDTTAFEFRLSNDNVEGEIFEDWKDYFSTIDSVLSKENLEIESLRSEFEYTVTAKVGQEYDDGAGTGVTSSLMRIREYTKEEHDFYSQVSAFSREFNNSETIVILGPWNNALDTVVNETLQLVIGESYVVENNEIQYHDLKIDGYSQITEEEQNSYLEQTNWEGWEKVQDTILTTNETLMNIIDVYNTYSSIHPNKYPGYSEEFTSSVNIVLPALADVEIEELMAKLSRAEQKLWDWTRIFSEKYEYRFWVDMKSPLLQTLRSYQENIQSTNALLVFITTPLIALALFLIYFSLALVEQRKQRLLAIMKMRGTSREQLRIILVEEVLSTGISAILVGMILSIPWTAASLSDKGIIGSLDFSSVVIPGTWFWKLPLIGLILALDMNLPSINKLISATVDEIESYEERKQPFWQRIYLDLILFFLSIIFWVSARFATFQNVGFFVFIMIQLSPIFFILFFVGAPLVTARYFADIISRVSDALWKISGGLLALATRNMRKNKFSASRLVSFLLLGMMLSTVAVIVPGTFTGWSESRINYERGADIVIENIDSSNATVWSMLAIPEVESYTEVFSTRVFTGSGNINTLEILGVNSSTFAQAAYWEDYYATDSLEALMQSMDTNNSILMQEGGLDTLNIAVGENFFISSSDKIQGQSDTIDFKIAGSFTYFPHLVYRIDDNNGFQDFYFSGSTQIVMNITLAKKIGLQSSKSLAYLNVKDGYNTSAVVEKLNDMLSFNSSFIFKDRDTEYSTFYNDPTSDIILSSLSSMLVITILASIIAVSYFSFITLAERRREIGVFRSMGMVRNQIFNLLLLEGLTLLIVALMLGFMAGFLSSSNILFFFAQLFTVGGSSPVPPINLIIPWRIAGIFTAVMIAMTTLAALIPAQLTASRQTGSILRAE